MELNGIFFNHKKVNLLKAPLAETEKKRHHKIPVGQVAKSVGDMVRSVG